MISQAYDGSSTMAGKISGVRKRIEDKYPNANYFHCDSYKLNLVINDLSDVSENHNMVGTIKNSINFLLEALQKLSKRDVNHNAKNRAFQLYNSCNNSTFLVCLFLMTESSILQDMFCLLSSIILCTPRS